MAPHHTQLRRLSGGQFDLLLAGALGLLATPVHLFRGEHWSVLIDLLACVAAGLATRWPQIAGVALGVTLLALLFVPSEWSSLGEYAALIPILGAGMRGQWRLRTWMTVGYGTILLALTVQDLPGNPLVLFAIGVWAALIAVLWAIGDLFAAYRKALEEAHSAALQQQRVALARDLHDTVARDLARASLRVQTALEVHGSADLEAAVAGIQQASAQLRWMLALLRDPTPNSVADVAHGALAEALAEITATLESQGFSVVSTVEGDLDAAPPALMPTLRAVIYEAGANIERHAKRGSPCAIIVSVSNNAIDAVFLNETPVDRAPAPMEGLGLAGAKERLALVGGELTTEQEGTQWITRFTIPV